MNDRLLLRYHRSMGIGEQVRAWRLARNESVDALALKAGLSTEALGAIEQDQLDPSVSVLEQLARAIAIPPAWLHGDPALLDLLTTDPEEHGDAADSKDPDPVLHRILLAARQERELYALLTRLIQHGDPKLIRAAEVSLRSLVKQARQVTVPWQSRPPGHFEPPSD